MGVVADSLAYGILTFQATDIKHHLKSDLARVLHSIESGFLIASGSLLLVK